MVDLNNKPNSQEILSVNNDPEDDFPLLNLAIELSKESSSEVDKKNYQGSPVRKYVL